MQSKEEILKEKFLMVEAWQQSGLSQKAWCIRESITYHIFHYWYRRYRFSHSIAAESSALPLDKSPAFSVLKVQPSFHHQQTTASIELLLPDGKRLFFHSPVSSDYIKDIIN